MRPSFVFDQNRCTGCQACQLACVIENDLEPDRSWRQIQTFNERHYPDAPLFHLSLACNHCAEPACSSACPALAYSKDSETGAVLLDQGKCIGCRYCTWACPYDAPKFDPARGVVSKCTFCIHRIKNGSTPACVELCPTGALQFEKLDETEITNDVDGFTTTDLQPAIRIIPLRDYPVRAQPANESRAVFVDGKDKPQPRITIKSEWPLALFTLIGASLFAVVAGGARVHSVVHPLAFLGAAALGMALSSAHLGRKTRAWRAVLNIRSSWLSREIVFFTLFAALGSAYLGLAQRPVWLGTAAVCTGLAALVSMDMVYRFTIRTVPAPHSAGVVLTGLFLTGLVSANPWIVVPLGVAKLLLYLWRKTAAAKSEARVHPLFTALRLSLGFGIPLVLIPNAAYAVVVGFVVLGELIDRIEYYGELDVMTPALQMKLDLTKRVAR